MKKFYQAGRAMSLLCFFLSVIAPVLGQQTIEEGQDIRPLSIGDTLPMAFWNSQVELYSKQAGQQTMKLAMLKGKAFVLDFLSTGCVSCMEALPRIQAIQKQYADRLEVFPVTSEKLERLQSFANTNVAMKTIDLPFVVHDRELKRWFPHQYISHLVWIDAAGVVVAITGASQFQDFTIADFLKGNTRDWPFKSETTSFFRSPILSFAEEIRQIPHNRKRVVNYAMLTGYTEGVGVYQATEADSLEGVQRISIRNRTLLELYLIAVDRLYKIKEEQIQVVLPNREGVDYRFADFSRMTVDAWMRKYGYCYERTVAEGTPEAEWKALMLQDLNHFLNMKGSLNMEEGKEVFRLETNK